MRWVVHEEISEIKRQKTTVYYLKKDKVYYGTCLNKALALALCDKYNRDEAAGKPEEGEWIHTTRNMSPK
jgi:hypothetical protein